MNIIQLNTIPLDGNIIIKKGSGGGTTPSKPKYTGHADAEGLRAIGWTDDDIAYYQANGVNWNEEDDEYHKVTDDNKALYGVLTASNISTYKDRIVYLPKIDTSGVTDMFNMFGSCSSLVAIPELDTSRVTIMNNMFSNCMLLTTVPQLNTSNVTDMTSMFGGCRSLVFVPQMDMSSVTKIGGIFSHCYSLTALPQPYIGNFSTTVSIFNYCYALTHIPLLDMSNDVDEGYRFRYCYSLTYAKLKGVKVSLSLSDSSVFSKDSLLYIINNEAATSVITIKLNYYAYTRLAEDADVVAALTNHPNISLASA